MMNTYLAKHPQAQMTARKTEAKEVNMKNTNKEDIWKIIQSKGVKWNFYIKKLSEVHKREQKQNAKIDPEIYS